MSRTMFAIIFFAIVIIIFTGMWLGWRARSRRDQFVATAAPTLTGDLLSTFSRIMYVSTTQVGAPLDRIAAPGLRYRGFSEIQIFTDGVAITVFGESTVRIPASAVQGTSNARVRVGKAVERNGLTLLQWNESENNYESTFRFEDQAIERDFISAVDLLLNMNNSEASGQSPASATDFSLNTQEDAR